MSTKIIKAIFGSSQKITVKERERYSYGQEIEFQDLNLPEIFEAYFSNSESGEAKPCIGRNNSVEIPDEYFLNGEPVFCYVLVHDESTDGRMMYTIKIPVINRPTPTNTEPTTVQQDIITDAIAVLQETSENVTNLANQVEQNTQIVENDTANVIQQTEIVVNKTTEVQEYANQSAESALKASQSEINANNYMESARQSALLAGESEVASENYSENALSSSQNANISASIAAQQANIATSKANQASTSESSARQSKISASESANIASIAATEASESALSANQSKTIASEKANDANRYASIARESADASYQNAHDSSQYANLALSAKESIENMSVTITTLPPDSPATINKSIDSKSGVVVLEYGIPQGEKGNSGISGVYIGTSEPTDGSNVWVDPSGDSVDVVRVVGRTPTINAVANTRYICGELLSLRFNPCETGICDVIFSSGSTPTVLTLPDTVKLPSDLSVIENMTYELNIMDGVYGMVMSWV